MAPRKNRVTETVGEQGPETVTFERPASIMSNAQAAAVLGLPVHEVDFVADSPAGTVITTADGASYLRTAAGELLFVNPPPNYSGPLAVYTPPIDDAPVADPDTGGDA